VIAARFGLLAALRKFGNEEDNLAQLTRRARQDTDLLQRMLRVYGYYDAEVIQSTTGFAAPAEGSGPATAIDLQEDRRALRCRARAALCAREDFARRYR